MDTKFSMALHILVMVSEEKSKALSSQDLARSVGTNASHIRKLTALLKSAKLLESHQGKVGFFLGKPKEEIDLGEVYRAVYPQKSILNIHKDANPSCPVGQHIGKVLSPTFTEMEHSLLMHLSKEKLADLIAKLYHLAKEDIK